MGVGRKEVNFLHVGVMLESWADVLHILGVGGVTTIALGVGYGVVMIILWIFES